MFQALKAQALNADSGRTWATRIWPRRLMSLVPWLVLTLVLAGLAAAFAVAGAWPGSGVAARTAVLAAVTAVVIDRVRRSVRVMEIRVWSWFAGASMLMTLASGADLTVRLISGTDAAGGYVFPAGVLAACFLLYQGLLLWNRIRTITADPSDLLNGVSATVAVAAICNLVLIWLHPDAQPGPWIGVQLHLLCVGAVFVLLGTVATVASMGSAISDPRAWLGLGAAAVALAGSVLAPGTGLVTGVPSLSRFSFSIGWLVVMLLVAVAARVPREEQTPKPATAQEASLGALVVLVAGAAILVLSTRQDPARTTTTVVYAGLAVLGASTRALQLIRDLANLAVRKQEALTDELTGLANRRAFTQDLAELVGPGRVASLLVIDLNDFKDVNDRLGHAVGDEVLAEAAANLRRATPEGGRVARLGGDEFAILLPGTTSADAVGVGWALIEAARRGPRRPGLEAPSVGLSIGVAGHDEGFGTGDSDELFRRADAAMYVAKTTGAQVSVYDRRLDQQRRDQSRLTHDLIEAFDNAISSGGLPFEVFYQPQVSMRTGTVAGVEALVRWRHPERGLLAPAAFLDLVESTGKMRSLTQFVVWSALRDAAVWERTGLGRMRVSVNLSTSCLSDPAFPMMLEEIVGAGVDPSVVTFEVTETTLMSDPDHSLAMCAVIVEAGFGLSIDDYGTGYSSLAYLSDLPATELKIDRAFVSRIQQDPRVRAIVSGTVDLAHELGLRIVAEGAEQPGTLGLLRDLGCDEVQGYVYSPPLPAVELYAWVTNQTNQVAADLHPVLHPWVQVREALAQHP